MTLSLARRHAWSLARTLMVCITLFKTGSTYGAMPSDEYDGEPDTIVHIYDPWG